MRGKRRAHERNRRRKRRPKTHKQVDAASAQESGPCVTGKHNAWESSNNAQRLSHNAPGGSPERERASNVLGNVGTTNPSRLCLLFFTSLFLTRLRLEAVSKLVSLAEVHIQRQGSYETSSCVFVIMHASLQQNSLTKLRQPKNKIKALRETKKKSMG